MRDLLPSVYPSSKQVKPKPNTAMRPSRVNIGIKSNVDSVFVLVVISKAFIVRQTQKPITKTENLKVAGISYREKLLKS